MGGGGRSGGDFHVVDGRLRFRDWLADFIHSVEMLSESVLEISSLNLILGVANGHTSGNVRRIGGVTRPHWFDDDPIAPRLHFWESALHLYESGATRQLDLLTPFLLYARSL